MSNNFLGSGDPKISFTWESELKTFLPDSHRIQFIPKFNIEESRVHKSVLNGAVTKEHLGFYHEAELYYNAVKPIEYEDYFSILEIIDSIILTPFTDNPSFTIEMIVEKAYPYKYQNFNESETAFYLKLKSVNRKEIQPLPLPPVNGQFLREAEWFAVLPLENGQFLREEEFEGLLVTSPTITKVLETVEITAPSGSIYYTSTTNGLEPTKPTYASALYVTPLTYSATLWVKAIAIDSGFISNVTSKNYDPVDYPGLSDVINVYKFIDNLDDEVSANTGRGVGTSAYVPSPFDKALSTTSSSYAYVDNQVDLNTNALTLYLRVKLSGDGSFLSIANSDGSGIAKLILQRVGGAMRIYNGAYSTTFGSGLDDGNYHNIITYLNKSTNTIKIWVDDDTVFTYTFGSLYEQNYIYIGVGYSTDPPTSQEQLVVWKDYEPSVSDITTLNNSGNGLVYP